MNTRSLSATLSLVLTCGLTQAAKDDGPVCDCNSTINDFFFTTYRAGLWISECPEVFCDMPFTNFTAARIGEVGWTGNPDYNRDFALDGFDVEALEYDIGNGCP